jgi:catechol 2,3-dioxygenase-like lactoylglutathione lyase family enzyme
MNKLLIIILISAVFLVAGCCIICSKSTKTKDGGIALAGAATTCLVRKHKNRIRIEHVAINVKDPIAAAKWYTENLDMKVARKGPPPVNAHFISDANGNVMLEIYNNPPDAVPDYPSMNPLSLHIAFMVDDIKAIRDKLTAAGATIVSDITITDGGDELVMLRDPWGVPIQFVKRAEPMLTHK